MKTGFMTKTIIPAMILLAWTAVYAADQMPPAASTGTAPAESATSVEKPDRKEAGKEVGKEAGAPDTAGVGKEKAPAEIALTINMKVPLFSPGFAETPVAAINDENIMIGELTGAIGAMHEGMLDQKTTERKSYTEILNRLINMKLMIQEARHIELDQLQEVKALVDVFEKTTLRELLFRQHLKDIKADTSEVEKTYRAQIKEWKIKTLLFDKEANAKKMVQEIKAGKNFDELVEKAVKAGLAKGGTEAVYMQAQGIAPQIVKTVAGMKVGSVSPVIPMETGFAIVKLDDIRFPESPEAREQAEKAVLNQARKKSLQAYRDSLVKKYVKINSKLLKQLDYEATKPGFKLLLDDKRILAEIRGEKPITVADLTKAISEKFFHGAVRAIKEKQVNILKAETLESLLQKRLFVKEALVQGIDKSDEYRNGLREYTDSIYFGIFIEKVIRPEVSVTEGELMDYHRAHVKEYTYPEMVRINGLAFTTTEAAQACIDKLKQGADFKWLKETMDGQVAGDAAKLLKFDGNLAATTEMAEELRKVITGVHSDDYRLYGDAAGHYYALHILEIIPPREKPYVEVREIIAKPVYDEALRKAIDEWAVKLRKASDVKVYADFGDIS